MSKIKQQITSLIPTTLILTSLALSIVSLMTGLQLLTQLQSSDYQIKIDVAIVAGLICIPLSIISFTSGIYLKIRNESEKK